MLTRLREALFPTVVEDPRIELGRKLYCAIQQDDFRALSALLTAGADINFKTFDLSPLRLAIQHDNPDMVRAVLAAGADPNERNSTGWSILHVAADMMSAQGLEILIAAGANIHHATVHGHTPLFHALPECFEALRKHGARIDLRDVEGRTPIHTLVWFSENITSIQALVTAGLDINGKDYLGRTPLMLAYKTDLNYGRYEMIDGLIALGADPLLTLEDTVSDPRALKIVLSHLDEDRLPTDILLRPLCHWSVTQLLDAGADANAVAPDGKTALMWHASESEIAALLIERGADVHATDDDGQSALHIAATWGEPESVKLLLAAGADPALEDNAGKTPIDCIPDVGPEDPESPSDYELARRLLAAQ